MSKTLPVAAIENGTVIDHIPAGQAIRIMHLLGLDQGKYQVTVGLNLPSKRNRFKDLIKIEEHVLSNSDANEITIFAPLATINIIRNFEVVEKITTSLPPSIAKVFICPNKACITHKEPVASFFMIEGDDDKCVNLVCRYCEKRFNRNQVKMRI